MTGICAYNDEMAFEYDNVKDFLVAHYKLTEREDTPFWQYVKHMSIPDALTEKLEADFRADLEHCVAFSAAEYKARRATSRLVDSTLRLCSPLL